MASSIPLVWDVLGRHVDREDGEVVSVVFVVRVKHPTFQEHYWKRMNPQPVGEGGGGSNVITLQSGEYYEDSIRAMNQTFEIAVPAEYGGKSLTAEQRVTLKALLRQEARRLRNDWIDSLIPASPERRSRQSLTKAEVVALLGE